MKRVLFIGLLILCPVSSALAITGDASRFAFSAGQPMIVDDTTSTCNNQATIRYDFTSRQPTGVFDSTATCASAGGGGKVYQYIYTDE